jgi:hypothetical protein
VRVPRSARRTPQQHAKKARRAIQIPCQARGGLEPRRAGTDRATDRGGRQEVGQGTASALRADTGREQAPGVVVAAEEAGPTCARPPAHLTLDFPQCGARPTGDGPAPSRLVE